VLHWLVVGLAAGVVALGWAMLAAPANTPTGEKLLLWHRSVGLVILVAMLFRLVWRWRHRPPPLPPSVPPLIAALAHAMHCSLYSILIAMPLAGYVSAAAAGHAVSLFGLVSLSPLLPENLRLSQAAIAVHLAGQYLFYFFVLLHIAGALYHAFVRGDGVFERMLPFWPAAVRAARAIIPVRRRAK
jgi:cytochrome b561